MFVLRALTSLDQMLMDHLMQQHAAVCYKLARISWHGELDQMRPIVISAAAGQPEPVPIWGGADDGNWQRMQFAAEVLSVEFEPCRCNVLAKCAPPNHQEPSHLREGDIRPAEVCLDMHHRRMWFDASTFSSVSTSCQVIAADNCI